MAKDVEYVGSGKYSDVFKVLGAGRGEAVIAKLSYYREDTVAQIVKAMRAKNLAAAMDAKKRDSIGVSVAMGRLANKLVAANASPHFALTYASVDAIDFASKVRPLIKARWKTSGESQLRYSNLAFLEVFTSNLTRYLRTGRYTESILRSIIFQILFTLVVLQRTAPGWRHNDLSANNVLVKPAKREPLRSLHRYRVGRLSFYVPPLPVLVAITDYDFTYAPSEPGLANERVASGKYKVTTAPTRTYDSHFFLKSITKSVYPRLDRLPDTKAFLASLPLLKDVDRYEPEIPSLVPETLLRHAYFRPLRRRPAAGWKIVADFAPTS